MNVGVLPVYIIHWNAPNWISQSTQTILASTICLELAVVNNGPQNVGDRLDPSVRIIETAANVGYAGGANVALEQWLAGTSPYCVIGSHDLQVEEATFEKLVDAAERHPDLGIVGANCTPGGYGQLVEERGDIEIRTWASGTCLLLRRECIRTIGGFDEDFHSYLEDKELGLRATDAGWKVGKVLPAQAKGLGSVIGDVSPNVFTNRVLLYRKRGGRMAGTKYWLKLVGIGTKNAFLSLRPGPRRTQHQQRATSAAIAVVRSSRYLRK